MNIKPYSYPTLPHYTPEEVSSLYPRVRQGEKAAIDRMIELHMRAALAKARRYGRNPHMLPDLVAVAMLALTQAVNRMAKGSLDCRPEPNPTSYLRKCIDGQVKKALTRTKIRLAIDADTYSRLRKENKWFPQIVLVDTLSGREAKKKASEDRMSTIRSCIETELEQKIISLRVQGYNDQEIGEMLDYSPARIGQIRKKVAERVRARLD